MRTTSTTQYSAPEITWKRDLSGAMMPVFKSIEPASDAQVKHRITPVEAYETPKITEQRDLSASTQFQSVER